MKNTSNIKVISLDLFQTIVNVSSNMEQIWRVFLGENYTRDFAQTQWDRATEIVVGMLNDVSANQSHFKNIRTLYTDSYRILFTESHINYDPEAAAEILIQGHRLDSLFQDAHDFLYEAGEKYTICLSTDCDLEMLDGIENIYSFDKIFVSEELKSYKSNPVFFNQVIKHYSLEPQNILHIGDSKQDIITPKKLGLLTCWLNRNNISWTDAIQPDFQIKTLMEIMGILEQN